MPNRAASTAFAAWAILLLSLLQLGDVRVIARREDHRQIRFVLPHACVDLGAAEFWDHYVQKNEIYPGAIGVKVLCGRFAVRCQHHLIPQSGQCFDSQLAQALVVFRDQDRFRSFPDLAAFLDRSRRTETSTLTGK